MKANCLFKPTLLVTVIFSLFAVAAPTIAQGPDDTLDWWTVDGGGGRWASADGQYALNGAIGQPDARVWSDIDYTLTGGFWSGGRAAGAYDIYLPVVLRNASAPRCPGRKAHQFYTRAQFPHFVVEQRPAHPNTRGKR